MFGREDFGEELLLECFDDSTNLVHSDHVAIKVIRIVGEVVVELFPPRGASLLITLLHVEA